MIRFIYFKEIIKSNNEQKDLIFQSSCKAKLINLIQVLNYKFQQAIKVSRFMNQNRPLKNPTTFFFEQAENILNPYAEQIQMFSKGLLNKQKCQLCKRNYDLKSRKPRIMIHCGHTFCTACLTKFFMNRRVRCPMCLKLVKQIDQIQRLPLNHTIVTHIMSKKNKQQGKTKLSFLDDPARMLFSQFERVQKQAHLKLNPPNIDPETNLPFCVFHPQRVQHFYCCGHQIAGCRVCTEIGHAKETCKVIDLYEIKNPTSLINSTLTNKQSSKQYMSFGLEDQSQQSDQDDGEEEAKIKNWLDGQIG